jgi:hypothetical protein
LLSKLEVEREVQTWAANYAVNKVEVDDDGTDGRLTPVERVDECTIEQVLRSCPPPRPELKIILLNVLPASTERDDGSSMGKSSLMVQSLLGGINSTLHTMYSIKKDKKWIFTFP